MTPSHNFSSRQCKSQEKYRQYMSQVIVVAVNHIIDLIDWLIKCMVTCFVVEIFCSKVQSMTNISVEFADRCQQSGSCKCFKTYISMHNCQLLKGMTFCISFQPYISDPCVTADDCTCGEHEITDCHHGHCFCFHAGWKIKRTHKLVRAFNCMDFYTFYLSFTTWINSGTPFPCTCN